jgi:hypothetical protein
MADRVDGSDGSRCFLRFGMFDSVDDLLNYAERLPVKGLPLVYDSPDLKTVRGSAELLRVPTNKETP